MYMECSEFSAIAYGEGNGSGWKVEPIAARNVWNDRSNLVIELD